MKLYGQRDIRWKDKKIGNSNSSIGDYGCVITCLAMLAGITPDDINTRLASVNGYQIDLILWQKIKEAVSWLELEWRGYSYDNDKVLDAINRFGGCMVEVDYDGKIDTPKDKHWVLFIGNQRMYDPWTGRECATSKYPIKTGYSIIKVYNKPIEVPEENMTEAEKKILQFIKETGATEGDVRQGIAYVKDGTVSKLEKDVEDLRTSLDSLEEKVLEINLKLDDKEDSLEDSQASLKSANKSLANKIKEFDIADNERKQWKSRYESKCQETADKLSVSELFKLLIQKLLNK